MGRAGPGPCSQGWSVTGAQVNAKEHLSSHQKAEMTRQQETVSGRARGGPPAQQKVIWPPEAGALTGLGPRLPKQHVREGRRLKCKSIPRQGHRDGRKSGGPRGGQRQLSRPARWLHSTAAGPMPPNRTL